MPPCVRTVVRATIRGNAENEAEAKAQCRVGAGLWRGEKDPRGPRGDVWPACADGETARRRARSGTRHGRFAERTHNSVASRGGRGGTFADTRTAGLAATAALAGRRNSVFGASCGLGGLRLESRAKETERRDWLPPAAHHLSFRVTTRITTPPRQGRTRAQMTTKQ